jgi:hypothetical protein
VVQYLTSGLAACEARRPPASASPNYFRVELAWAKLLAAVLLLAPVPAPPGGHKCRQCGAHLPAFRTLTEDVLQVGGSVITSTVMLDWPTGPERGAWRKRHVVHVAVQGLVHSEHEPSHTTSFPHVSHPRGS